MRIRQNHKVQIDENLVHITIQRFDVLTKIGQIMPYAATHCHIGETTSLLPTTQGDNIECSCMNVAVHLCRHIGLQFDHLNKFLTSAVEKHSQPFFFKKKKKAEQRVSLRQVGLCFSTLNFLFLFVGLTVGTMFHNQ